MYNKADCKIIVDNALGIVAANSGGTSTGRKMPGTDFRRASGNLGTLMRQRNKHLSQEFMKHAKTRAAAEAITIADQKSRILSDMFTLSELRPAERNALQRTLSLALDWNFGNTGMAKRAIDQQKKTAISMIDNIARLELGVASKKLYETIESVTGKLPTLELQILASEAIQIGVFQDAMLQLSDSAGAIALNTQRVTNFYHWASTKYGLTPTDIATILRSVSGVSDVFDKIRLTAKAAGVDLSLERNLGYLHRSFTPLAERRLQDVLPPDSIFEVGGGGSSFSPISNIGKQFSFYQPTSQQTAALFAEITGLSDGKLFAHADPSLGFNWLQGRASDVTKAVVISGGTVLEVSAASVDRIRTLAKTLKSKRYLNSSTIGKISPNGTVNGVKAAVDTAFADLDAAIKAKNNKDIVTAERVISKLAQSILQANGFDGLVINAKSVITKGAKQVRGDSWLLNWNLQLDDFMSNTTMQELFSDPYAMLEFIRNRLTREQVEALVDSGVISKIPMSNMEVFAYLNEYFAFGFDDPAQMMKMGIEEAGSRYVEQLRTAVKTSSTIQVLTTKQAADAGWVVLPGDPEYLADTHADWVPFGPDFMNALKAMGVTDSQQLEDISRMKVHPDIARMYRTYLRIAADPTTQNSLAQGAITVANNSAKYGIAQGGLGLVVRNFTETAVSALQWGTNPFRLKQGQDIIWHVFSTGDLSKLDDTKPAFEIDGVQYTLRGIVRLYFKTQADNSAVELPGALGGSDLAGGIGEFLNRVGRAPDNTKQWFRWANAGGDSFTGAELGLLRRLSRNVQASSMLFGGAIDEAWVRIINTSNIIQHGVQLSHFMSQIRPVGFADNVYQAVGRGITGELPTYAKTREELLLRMQDSFIDPLTMGTASMAGNKGFGMFLQYLIKSPYQFAKAVARNPVKAYKFGQAQAVWRGIAAENCDAKEVGFHEFELEENPHYMGCFTDKEGQKQTVLLFPQNFDSYNKVWTMAQGMGSAFREIVFDEYGNAQSRVAANVDETTGRDALVKASSELISYGRPEIQAAASFITGKDLFDREIAQAETDKRPSFWFWQLDSRTRATVSSLIPIARYIDDLNIGGMFGYAPVYDANGNVIYDGKLGMLGNERYPARTIDKLQRHDNDVRLFLWRVLKTAGFNVRVTATANTSVTNARQLDNAISTYEREFTNTLKSIQEERARGIVINEEEQARRSLAVGSLITELLWMKNERIRMDITLQNDGVVPPRVQAALTNAGVMTYTNIYGLDPDIDEQMDKAAEEVADMLQEYKDYIYGEEEN